MPSGATQKQLLQWIQLVKKQVFQNGCGGASS